MKPNQLLAIGIVVIGMASSALAQIDREDLSILAGGPAATAQHDQVPAYTHPTLPPPDTNWPGAMIIIIGGMFLAAMVIGPVVRANMPDEVPVHDSHDEPIPDAHGGHGHH